MSIARFQGRIDESGALIPPRRPNMVRALMFACPLFFTSFVAIKARSAQDSFQIPSGTPAQDAQVLAYVPFVEQTQQLTSGEDFRSTNRMKLLALCSQWDQAVRKDVLGPVFPVSFEDTPEEGARASIMRSKSQLVSFLLADAERLFKSGQSAQAVSESLLAMRLSESLKYSDFTNVFLAANEQKRAVALLENNADGLKPADKRQVANQFRQIMASSGDLEAMTKYTRIQYYDWLKRTHQDEISIEDVHRMALVTERIATDPTSKETLRYIRTAIVESPDEDGPEYLSQLRMAYSTERSNQRGIKELAKQL